jgi:SAM-dependent methyltransferase
MPSDDQLAVREHLLRVRAETLQPLVPSAGKVLEYHPRHELNLAAIRAGTKIALTGGKAPFLPEDVQSSSSIDPYADLDLIICDHVLEYMADPVTPLEGLKIALKPGGKLLVRALYDPAFRAAKSGSWATHFYSWNVQTLGNLLVDCGYEFHSGAVERCFNEKVVTRWAPKIGLPAAAFLARLFAKERQVRVVATAR